MKKTAIVLLLAVLMIAAASSLYALAERPGPPPGPPPHGGALYGGPPGPPPGPPPRAGEFFGGPPGPSPHGGGFPGLWGGPPDLIEKLNLTDDQLKQMRLLYVDFQDRTRKARNALMALHDEKRIMLISGKIDQAKLAKLDEDSTKLASEVMAEDLKMKREQLSKLTPEQVNLLADFFGKKEIAHGPKMMAR
jgi:Spy/CpxP family protein refolding chaperone